ncbi:ABC transporter substrate-binding protein [Paenibacillus agricola]|uniref:ABC transporter substrate-binding protein n=1 Tax=Paenibacillus agricola TaxID=2716264 RepID=A0ABX0JJI8_9BACL|nr:ABC transporter substrate-binding protein [Paenibacillus agricola]NHN34076.1 ABC transporter substrate-binding protein [Paenibacillus agricola]
MKLKTNIRKRLLFPTLTASILVGILSGCMNTPAASTSTQSTPTAGQATTAASGGKLRVGIITDFGTLDPAKSTRLIDEELYNNIYDPMVKLTPDGKFLPGLATKWTISEDGKTYTFELRKEVKFHDGTDFNAQAVMDNWNWIIDPANASPRKSDLVLVESMTAPDPYTLVVQLKTPFIPFIATITGRTGLISSMTAKKKAGDQYEMAPVGTGPFQFVEWNKNDHLTIKKNPNYWEKDQPKLDEVEFKPIINQSQKLNALISGQVDLVDSIPFQDIPKVENTKSLKLGVATSFGYSRLTLNLQKAPFNNINNRRAINFAINRDEINQIIYFGKFVPGFSFFSPAGFANDPSIKVPYSVELAKEELKKAGNPDGFSFSFLSANDPQSMQLAQLFQSQLAKVGITMKIEALDSAAITQKRNSGDWEVTGGGWSGMIDPDQNSYAFIVTNAPFNYGKYSNTEVDKLMQEARESSSNDVRKKIYSQVSAILIEEVPGIFTGYQPVVDVWTDKVQGFDVYPDQLLRLYKTTISK